MANGRGTVYLRAGQWTIGFTVNGRRVRETIGPNKRLAEMVLKKRMTEAMENRYFPPQKRNLGRMPFREFGDMYLERVVPLMKSSRTEKTRVLRWMKDFGNRLLGQITRAEIEAWRRQKLVHCRPATINRDSARLRHMLNIAVEWELLEESPMAGMKFLRENNARSRYLTLEECQRLIANCIVPHVRAIVTMALHTGMRLGEILALRWQDLDFSSNFVLIRDSKNGESRHVPMDAAVSALLRAYPRQPDVEFVFLSVTGGRLRDIRTGFSNARRRAGLTDLRFHDLRHSFSSQFVMAGGNVYILKEILGHKSITMTQRYAHLSPAYKAKAIDHMNTFWQNVSTPQIGTYGMALDSSSVTPASQTVLNRSRALGEIL